MLHSAVKKREREDRERHKVGAKKGLVMHTSEYKMSTICPKGDSVST